MGLKVTMYAWGGVGLLAGLLQIILPEDVARIYGLDQIPDYVRWLMAFLGAVFVASGFWTIEAGQDPVSHINWVKYQITVSTLVAAVTGYSIIKGDVSFSQAGMVLLLFALAAGLLLAFYPWSMERRQSAGEA